MIKAITKGNSNKTKEGLQRIQKGDIFSDLDRYGRMGVDALSRATPVESGFSANSWDYIIIKNNKFPGIQWINTNVTDDGTPIVILIQYGHATGSGSYVAGRDFINPTMRPIFDQISQDVWKKVKS